jgi:putative endonuclease
MIQNRPCGYILASGRNGTLYIEGQATWRSASRASVKRYRRIVKDYSVHRLVFVEFHNTTEPAILRKKRLKKWRRAWKLELIERHNPDWCDLYDELAL